RPSHLLLWEADEADHVEDITTSIDAKLDALLEHRSQYRTTMDVDDPSSTEQLDRFRNRIRERAATAGAGGGIAYGEQFKLISKL
ncbi:MAG: PIG-L family deacetylase, partial [Actinomycetota bacterium]|nr:PIG-L family deacetylase [Actinomycetota bacterium]